MTHEFPEQTAVVVGRHAAIGPGWGVTAGKAVPLVRNPRLDPILTYAKAEDGQVTLRVDDRNDPSFWLVVSHSDTLE